MGEEAADRVRNGREDAHCGGTPQPHLTVPEERQGADADFDPAAVAKIQVSVGRVSGGDCAGAGGGAGAWVDGGRLMNE